MLLSLGSKRDGRIKIRQTEKMGVEERDEESEGGGEGKKEAEQRRAKDRK